MVQNFVHFTKNINIVDLVSSNLILLPHILLPELLVSNNSTQQACSFKLMLLKLSKPQKPNPWYTSALLAFKSASRHLERKYISDNKNSTRSNKPISFTDCSG